MRYFLIPEVIGLIPSHSGVPHFVWHVCYAERYNGFDYREQWTETAVAVYGAASSATGWYAYIFLNLGCLLFLDFQSWIFVSLLLTPVPFVPNLNLQWSNSSARSATRRGSAFETCNWTAQQWFWPELELGRATCVPDAESIFECATDTATPTSANSTQYSATAAVITAADAFWLYAAQRIRSFIWFYESRRIIYCNQSRE